MLSVEIKKEDWDQKVFDWQDKPFYHVSYASFLGLPLTREMAEARALQMLSQKNLLPGKPIILRSNSSLFGGDLFIELENANDVEHKKMSGKFFTMFFEGNSRHIPTWKNILKEVARTKNMAVSEVMPYLAGSHDKNCQVVLIARVDL